MIKKTLHVTLAVLALCFAVNAHANHIEIKPFDTVSMEAIHAQYKGRPFVLSFWATTYEKKATLCTLPRTEKML